MTATLALCNEINAHVEVARIKEYYRVILLLIVRKQSNIKKDTEEREGETYRRNQGMSFSKVARSSSLCCQTKTKGLDNNNNSLIPTEQNVKRSHFLHHFTFLG